MKQFNINVINNFQNNSEELIKAKFKTEEALVNQLCENLEKGFITKDEFEKSLDIVKAVSTDKERTAKVIEEAAIFEKNPIEKSENSDDEDEDDEDLEKGGEGSKGGKVIGHTKSGKPIYGGGHNSFTSSRNHAADYASLAKKQGYTSEDHADAAEAHKKDYDKKQKKSETSGVMHKTYSEYHQKEGNVVY